MQEFRLKIGKMTCVNCSNAIEKTCKKLDGVKDASVSYANSSGVFLLENEAAKTKLKEKISALGFEILNDDESIAKYKEKELKRLKFKLLLSITLSVVLMIFEMFIQGSVSNFTQMLLSIVGIFYCGSDFFIHAFKGLKNKSLDMNTLVSLGVLVTFIYSLLAFFGIFDAYLYFGSACMIISFVLLGKFLEENAKFKANHYQKNLENLDTKKTLRLKENGEFEEILSAFVKVGDVILVKEGESICVDGSIVKGSAELDMSFLNGEFLSILKQSGESVQAGSVIISGNLQIKAEKKAVDSTLEQIKDLIFNATNSKMPIARLTNVVSAYFVGFILLLALGVFVFWAFKENLNSAFLYASATLLISCPCALGLATPIAIICALSNGARNFILIKNPSALELLKKVKFALFDKTGTLSENELCIFAHNLDEANFTKLRQISSLSSHPISKALSKNTLKQNLQGKLNTLVARGLIYEENEEKFFIGNEKLLKENDILISNLHLEFAKKYEEKAPVLVFFANSKECLGVVCLNNALRKDAKDLIEFLKTKEIKSVILSGDNEKSVKQNALNLGIDEFKFGLNPTEKLEVLKSYQSKAPCLFVGDGINDAAALSLANVSISMQSASSLAKNAGDFILMNDELKGIKHCFLLSFKTMKIIKQNLFWAFFYNSLCIPIAAGFVPNIVLSPHLAAMAMSFSSVIVVLNSLRLRKF